MPEENKRVADAIKKVQSEIDAGARSRDLGEPNPKQLFGDLKVPLQFIPATAIVALGIGLAEGGRKYGPFNWREIPVEYMTYVGAVMRHLQAWVDGENFDPDSGNPHLYHAIASLAILIDAVAEYDFRDTKMHIDNRPAAGAAGQMMSDYVALALSKVRVD